MKDLQIVEMHDNIRRMIIAKFELRSKIAESMEGKIIPLRYRLVYHLVSKAHP